MTFRGTLIRPELSAWTCQPFCCQRAFALIPSERPSIPLRHRLASLPDNKKPGVERRAKPPFRWLCAKLDSFLSSARNEPHYRVYFRPSLDLTLGRRFFYPTVMPLLAQQPPSHLRVYKILRIRQAPANTFFGAPCELLCKSEILENTGLKTNPATQPRFHYISNVSNTSMCGKPRCPVCPKPRARFSAQYE
jgi:hypothetical protein